MTLADQLESLIADRMRKLVRARSVQFMRALVTDYEQRDVCALHMLHMLVYDVAFMADERYARLGGDSCDYPRSE